MPNTPSGNFEFGYRAGNVVAAKQSQDPGTLDTNHGHILSLPTLQRMANGEVLRLQTQRTEAANGKVGQQEESCHWGCYELMNRIF